MTKETLKEFAMDAAPEALAAANYQDRNPVAILFGPNRVGVYIPKLDLERIAFAKLGEKRFGVIAQMAIRPGVKLDDKRELPGLEELSQFTP